jgi:hypothetical protein
VKALLAIVSGFLVSLGMFAGGLAFAVYLLAVDPVRQPGPSMDVADLWTAEPRRVDKTAQDLERVPVQIPARSTLPAATPPVQPTIGESAVPPTTPAGVDSLTTAGIPPAPGENSRQDRLQLQPSEELEQPTSEDAGQPAQPDELSAAHMEWCTARYRSYRSDDNSYTSYSGARQPCVSPYSRDLAEGGLEPLLGPPPTDRAASEFDGFDQVFVEEMSPVQYAADEIAAYDSDHVSYCFSRYRSYRPEDNTYQPFGGGPRRQCR